MRPSDRCAVCEDAVSVLCSQCEVVAYCGAEHQKSHWPEHKNLCSPCRIERSDKLGRSTQIHVNIIPDIIYLLFLGSGMHGLSVYV
jgi:hypothetical protein